MRCSMLSWRSVPLPRRAARHERAGCAMTSMPATPIGLARLAKLAFDGADLSLLWEELSVRALAASPDAGALMDLSTIAQLMGRRNDRLALQAHALALQRVYRQPPAVASDDGFQLVAF